MTVHGSYLPNAGESPGFASLGVDPIDALPSSDRLARARLSLEGLSVGDALGGRFFLPPGPSRELPPGPWSYSDDTVMASVIVARLAVNGAIDPELLALDFARAYQADAYRGYGQSVRRVLDRIAEGVPWRVAAGETFGGGGSMGNGGAMRVAPLGGYFADDLAVVAEQADRSAVTTHAHPEGRAGAVAVAIAAAMIARGSADREMLEAVLDWTAPGATREGIAQALRLGSSADPQEAAGILGNGQRITAPDTVPFALWCVAKARGHYEEAIWSAVSVGGDNDTLGAIVGGVVALAGGLDSIPERWRRSREPLRTPAIYQEERS